MEIHGGAKAAHARHGEGAWQVSPWQEVERLRGELEGLRSELEEKEGRLAQALHRARQAEDRSLTLTSELAICASAGRARDEKAAQRLAEVKESAIAAHCAALGEARAHALRGGAGLARAAARAGLHAVFAAWRTWVMSEKAVAKVQAKLFAEESSRGAALRAQKIDLDTRYMDAEARHRSAMQRVRAEFAEAELVGAEKLAAQESESARRLVAAEADFLLALREAARGSEEAQSSTSSTLEAGGGAATTGHDEGVRLAQALSTLRRRADVQRSEAEARHAEALLAERERSERRLAAAEKRQEEAVQAAREAGERRLLSAEAQHMEAIRELRQQMSSSPTTDGVGIACNEGAMGGLDATGGTA